MSEYTGYVVKSAYILEHHNLTDYEIYQEAKNYGNVILVSKDADFTALISKLRSPPKLIDLKIGNSNNQRYGCESKYILTKQSKFTQRRIPILLNLSNSSLDGLTNDINT